MSQGFRFTQDAYQRAMSRPDLAYTNNPTPLGMAQGYRPTVNMGDVARMMAGEQAYLDSQEERDYGRGQERDRLAEDRRRFDLGQAEGSRQFDSRINVFRAILDRKPIDWFGTATQETQGVHAGVGGNGMAGRRRAPWEGEGFSSWSGNELNLVPETRNFLRGLITRNGG